MIRIYKILFNVCISFFILNAQPNLEIEKYLDEVIVQDICSDGQNLWIASNGKGIYRYTIKSNKWENYSTTNEKLQHDYFYSIAANEQYVWAGSIDGLFILDKNRNNWSKRKFGLGGQLSNWIRSLAYDKYTNVLWIGRFKYLTKFDLSKRRFSDYDLTVGGDEKTNTIKIIKVDGDSLVWFGTEAGLHKHYKSKELDEEGALFFYNNRFNYFNGDGDKVSISALLFERNNIWIGSDEFITFDRPNYNVGGLYKFNRKNRWDRFDVSAGLPGNGISTLELTGNYIWVGTYQFGKSNKEPYGRGIAILNRTTGQINVIHDERIPDNINCSYFDGENIWFGSDNGLLKIYLGNKFASWNNGESR
ncbi:MAG: hypothetical protein A2V66_16545 [Ignavibacteria bacterium RBG_13_36_8]|nr:MAG: hypothetical protein A2V66_16545 [Ignavibacteria bacterium RBG_13_36_8]